MTALVLHADHRIGTRALKNRWLWGISTASFVAIFAFDTPFPAIVLAAGLIGHVGARHWPQVFALGGGHGSAKARYGPALIDDDTPTRCTHATRAAAWARWSGSGSGYGSWGWQGLSPSTGCRARSRRWAGIFTKAGLLTFVGAYAVLPYVYQGAVETHQWLSGPQMIDGPALGETTPGPLIMMVAFVGFVGGWLKVFGPEALFLGGAVAAAVATFFTFIPSFVFILAADRWSSPRTASWLSRRRCRRSRRRWWA